MKIGGTENWETRIGKFRDIGVLCPWEFQISGIVEGLDKVAETGGVYLKYVELVVCAIQECKWRKKKSRRRNNF